MKSKDLSFQMPDNACNAHLHIIDPSFPNDGKAETQRGTVEEYRYLADTLGLTRAVLSRLNLLPWTTLVCWMPSRNLERRMPVGLP